ncbi:MAG: Phosphate acyltransferase [Candidatus Dichloromethanomonas elyunquensis]|nr:MAG: Phosphate acyltransferase [Candidatus Dichloromethanomonas elyunquensis]
MKIAVDAMGGDYAPAEIVKGALKAAAVYPHVQMILVGQKDKILEFIPGQKLGPNLEIYEASEVIAQDEHPAAAIKKKKDASIVVATSLVKEGTADALVSAGSTGAQMAAALLGLGRIKGINRPAIATVLPTLRAGKLLIDVGANPDAKPENLLQYGMMGSIYAEMILGIKEPKVALLNIGSEEGKGNELVQAAYGLLKNSSLNFIGNIEGRDIPYGTADVIVCDAFIGNIVLKTIEGMASSLFQLIKEKITANSVRKIGALLIKPGLKEIAHTLDYSEYGGAPLLGVNGTSVICHGSSKEKAIFNAIRVAKECIEEKIIEKITAHLEKTTEI